MKIARYVLAAHHAYGWRQQRIERFRPTRGRQNFVRNIDVRALRERVDACVCASGTMNAHRSASDASKRALQMILDRVAVRLALPSGEWRAVVSDNEFQPSCHSILVIGDQ